MSKAETTNTTRRRVIAGLASAPALSAGTALATSVAAADPIFAAIKRHEAATAACHAVEAEINRMSKAADEAGFPSTIQVQDRRNPPLGWYVPAWCESEINMYVPPEQWPQLNEFYREQLRQRREERAAFLGDFKPDEAIAPVADEQIDALIAFTKTVPTTLPGLLAAVSYAGKLAQDPEFLDYANMLPDLFKSLAVAAARCAEG